MNKQWGFCLVVLFVFSLLFTGAQADKPATYHTLFEIVYHQPGFAYQVTSLSAVSDQAVQAQVTLFALDHDWPVNKTSFVLMDAHSQAYYANIISIASSGTLIEEQIIIPAGMNCSIVFHIPYQGSQFAAMYWVCMDAADSYSCTQFNYMPQQTNAANYSTVDEFFNPTSYSASDSSYTNPYSNSTYNSDWDYSFAPVDDFFSADTIDFGYLGGSDGPTAIYVTGGSTGSYVTCFPCNGTGVCSLCDGKGKMHIGTTAECTCPSCYGSGECVYCCGTGLLESD